MKFLTLLIKAIFIGLFLLAFLLALSGCKPEESEPCNTKYAHDDTVGSTGLYLKATSEPFIPFSQMEAVYREVQSCIGVSAPAPLVHYRSFSAINLGGVWGVMYAPTNEVWINTDDGIAPRNCHSDRETLRHEFVHHVLYLNGMDYSHGSPYFERCKAVGVNVCDGIPCKGDR